MLTLFDLNFRHLRALSAIVSRGSMSAAAAAVGLSQPALTQGLSKLERRIDAVLFVRRSDGVVPTEAGQVMAERADAAFARIATAVRGHARVPSRGFSRPEHLMTATQTHAFLRLAEAGSFVDAARATGLSNPALHRAVRDLEQIFGIALVERRGRGVVLTPAGRRLARGVRLAAAEIDAGLGEISGEDGRSARIAVGAMPLSRALVLPHAIGAFSRANPRSTVEVFEGAWRDLVESLRDGAIDLMVGALRDPAPAGLVQEPLFEDSLTIVGRAAHPLAGTPDPTLAELAAHGWIVGQRGAPLRRQWERLFTGCALPPAPIECGSVIVIRGLLCDSDLLTLLSPDQIALEVRAGLLAPIGAPLGHGVRTIGITTRADWRPARLQRHFIDAVRTAADATRIPKSQ